MAAELSTLENYTPTPSDGAVVAWPVEVMQPDREGRDPGIDFRIMAQVLRETEEGRAAREAKEAEEKRLKEEEEARPREEAMYNEEKSGDGADGSAGRESEATADDTGEKDEL